MRLSLIIFIFFIFLFSACAQNSSVELINPEGKTISKRILTPEGFSRIKVNANSYGSYLRHLPLKEDGSKVKFYNGVLKPNFWVYSAVVDIDVGERNLQQCADAVMRLRGEYLYQNNRFDQIHFNFTNGFRVDYSEWMTGNRIVVEGNKSYWKKQTSASNSYSSFRKYMDIIFAYAGTLSLAKELKEVKLQDIQIGDVFIQGGSPGHAVIVVDLAADKSGNKIFLLAQSYMPAQDIHILKNPNDKNISPWYSIKFDGNLVTPEWTFKKTDLKRFRD